MTFPFVLLWRSVSIYVLPMIRVYVGRFFGFLARSCFASLECLVNYKYTDHDFPAEWYMGGDPGWDGKYDWIRCSDLRLPGEKPLCLFHDGIEPADINQQDLGDCWFLGPLAALATHPGAIRRCFVNTEINDRGKYQVYFYLRREEGNRERTERHGYRLGQRIKITIDDYIPVKKGTRSPMFAAIGSRHEIWVALLEKAMAKFMVFQYGEQEGNVKGGFDPHTLKPLNHPEPRGDGLRWIGYEAISGDYAERTLYHLTGDPVYQFLIGPHNTHHTNAQIFAAMEVYHNRGGFLATHRGLYHLSVEDGGPDPKGVAAPHIYGITGVYRAGTFMGLGIDEGVKLVKVQNPWGSGGEYKGAWGDGSKEWDEHPQIAREVGYVDKYDGTFFMHIDDFVGVMGAVLMCDRCTKDDLVLEYQEDPENWVRHLFAPLLGCVSGLFSFWFLGRGIRTIYFGHPGGWRGLWYPDNEQVGRIGCVGDGRCCAPGEKIDPWKNGRPLYYREDQKTLDL